MARNQILDSAKINLYRQLLVEHPDDMTDDEVTVMEILSRDPAIQERMQ